MVIKVLKIAICLVFLLVSNVCNAEKYFIYGMNELQLLSASQYGNIYAHIPTYWVDLNTMNGGVVTIANVPSSPTFLATEYVYNLNKGTYYTARFITISKETADITKVQTFDFALKESPIHGEVHNKIYQYLKQSIR